MQEGSGQDGNDEGALVASFLQLLLIHRAGSPFEEKQ